MPNWNQDRGFRHDRDEDRQGADDRSQEWRRREAEQRSFGQRGRFNSDQERYAPRSDWEGDAERWRRDRYAARFDQDRMGYRGGDERGRQGEARRGGGYYGGEPQAYAGQEYGLESHRDERRGDWGFEQHGGVERPQQGARPEGARWGGRAQHPDQEFDPDYLRWRDEQLRAHDRDYDEWRRHQHQQYDEEYRKFRTERREHFGRAFHEWRSQRSAVGGVTDTTVAPGVSGYGDKTAIPGGYNARIARDMPTGAPPSHSASSHPTAGHAGPAGSQSSGDRAPEFGKEPPQVKAASEGGDTRRHEENRGKEAKGEDRRP